MRADRERDWREIRLGGGLKRNPSREGAGAGRKRLGTTGRLKQEQSGSGSRSRTTKQSKVGRKRKSGFKKREELKFYSGRRVGHASQ